MHRCLDEFGRIVGNDIVHALGEALGGVRNCLEDEIGRCQRIGARLLDDRHANAGYAAEIAAHEIGFRAELDARDIIQPGHGTVGITMHHNIGKFRRFDQTATHLHRQLESRGLTVGKGGLAEIAAGRLDVLGAQGVDDIDGGQTARGGPVRIDPDTHGIAAGTENADIADPV